MTEIVYTDERSDLNKYITAEDLSVFLKESLKPFDDDIEDIMKGIDFALSAEKGKGGFILLAMDGEELQGALIMLHTELKGFIPPYILLYIAVRPESRGRGIGGKLISEAFERADDDIKLHVEHDNPAKRLYERMGFTSKYAEMRYNR